MSEPTSRICREVQEHLPLLVDGTLPGWKQRLVRRHLRRCEDCATELRRQEAVTDGLRHVGDEIGAVPEPPDELLDTLLERAKSPGLRERAAVPARGAVSGARPALSITLLLASAAVGTALGMVIWRVGRSLARSIRGDNPTA